jgi:hypothetical protein
MADLAKRLPLADLGLAAAAGAAWYNWPELAFWPLLVVLIPWGIRLAAGQRLLQKTVFDGPLLIFLLFAALGVWTAYDPAGAWAKFWLLVGGVLLFTALAGQTEATIEWIAMGLGLFGAAVAGYFLLTHDWRVSPADFAALNRIGVAWMAVRPTLPTHVLHPNVASGIIALCTPFLLASARLNLSTRRPAAALFLILTGLAASALLLATSRGALAALAAALSFWGVATLIHRLEKPLNVPAGTLMNLGLAAGVVLVLGLLLLVPDGLVGLVNRLPGPANIGSRMDLIRALQVMITDVPFTGSGLNSFPGWYSQYVLLVPSFILSHGHNLFLDVALEMGIAAALTLLFILIGSWALLWMAAQKPRERLSHHLIWASLTSLTVLLLHGLIDDVLFGSRAPLLLFLPSGIGLAALKLRRRNQSDYRPSRYSRRLGWGAAAVLVLVLLGILASAGSPGWQVNQGALLMARTELADWPTDQWADGSSLDALQPAADRFMAAQAGSPNPNAAFRLGLLAMLDRDFGEAIEQLEVARVELPEHQGVQKALAYSYLWNGDLLLAADPLHQIRGVREELRIYTWWWTSQGYPELSTYAENMLRQLQQNEG